MQEIYREMFLADQWLEQYPSKREKADTTWFYEPIFEKRGYDLEDYRNSVKHYLSDPERYAKMMRRVRDGLRKETARLNDEVAKLRKLASARDSIAALLETYRPKGLEALRYYPGTKVFGPVKVEADSSGAMYFVPVPPDTTYNGPEIVARLTAPATDSASAVAGLEKAVEAVVGAASPKESLPKEGLKKDGVLRSDIRRELAPRVGRSTDAIVEEAVEEEAVEEVEVERKALPVR